MNEELQSLKEILKTIGVEVPEEATFKETLDTMKKNKNIFKAQDKKIDAIKKAEGEISGENKTSVETKDPVEAPKEENKSGEENKDTKEVSGKIPPQTITKEKEDTEEEKPKSGQFSNMY